MISWLSPVPSLPEPLGPHKVGTIEWEIPISEIPLPTPVPDPQISTLKFRIFYPTLSTATSKISEPWLPQPQRAWSQAYASFMGASPKLSSLVASFPFFLNYTKLPATPDTPLLPRDPSSKYPVVVFSHGLGGNFNTYSAICTSLASFGIVCVAPEHRDGSAPITFIRAADGTTTSIGYQRYPHTPTPDVLTSRNAQLRIRVWELEQLFTVLTRLNSGGQQFSNYAARDSMTAKSDSLSWNNKLDLRPGRVTWAGHSFGACAMVQLVKSVYYSKSTPSLEGTPYENDLDWQPLYKPTSNFDLVCQITPGSPIALLDLWAMPLHAEQTRWLFEKPLPCYDQDPTDSGKTTPTVVAIVTAEFYRHTELLYRMRAALSPSPAEATTTLEGRIESSNSRQEREELTKTTALSAPPSKNSSQTSADVDVQSDSISTSPHVSSASSPQTSSVPSRTPSPIPGPSDVPSPASSTTSVSSSFPSGPERASRPAHPSHPKMYLVPSSAHLSQSDFGLLFPRLVRYLTKAEEPEEIIALNVRAILSMMRGTGLEPEPFKCSQSSKAAEHEKDAADEDDILTERCKEKRFVPVPLAD
ncbi:hypothetical protein A1O3_01219 [Capronia epimyces CBS 606.96]|uniref:Putative phospholipase n=1 Tax=Capronia epimyces CBS 606.96 TaxID=1182542 RepID=W9YIE6_9EURO|nr:uncharacterized protein A1O3_01219 [Capronia epimyces CBS 606.96]EXJ92667.1 hypothetical protein A1O3_01219 [Capronia epimyces CBS 606.96]